MSNLVLYSHVENVRTLPKPFYKFVLLVESLISDVNTSLRHLRGRDIVLEPSPINLEFARVISGEFSKSIKTPLGNRKLQTRGPIVAHLNAEFHATDLPFANRSNVFVTGFSSKSELLVSELDRDGHTIYHRLINPQTRRVVAKTVRGNCEKWDSWD